MGARMLLSLLGRMSPPEAVAEREIIDGILATLFDSSSEMPEEDTEIQGWGSQVGSNVGGGQRMHNSEANLNLHQASFGSDVSGGNAHRRPASDVGFVGGGRHHDVAKYMQQQNQYSRQNQRANQQARAPDEVGIAALMAQRSGLRGKGLPY
jgi:hypothetical protein